MAMTSEQTAAAFDQLTLNIRRYPVRALTLSAGAGFMLGGGLRSRLGLALGLMIGRTLAGTVVVNAIESISDENGRNHRHHSKRARRSAA